VHTFNQNKRAKVVNLLIVSVSYIRWDWL